MDVSRPDPARLRQDLNGQKPNGQNPNGQIPDGHNMNGLFLALALGVLLMAPPSVAAQLGSGTENGEWHYLGGDAAHTRYSPLDQIDASNFEDLEVAWIWRADNFGPTVDYAFKSTPSFIDGMLYTVVSERR